MKTAHVIGGLIVLKWVIGAGVIGALYYMTSNRKPYLGMVSSGWGGSWAPMPAVMPQSRVVGDALSGQVYAPPGVPYAPPSSAAGSAG